MSGVKLLLQHVLLCIRYYFHRRSWCCGANNWRITKYLNQFIERRWWNSTKKLFPIWYDSRFKKSKNNFRTGCFAFRKRLKAYQAKKLFKSQEIIWKGRENFLPTWYNKQTWLHYGKAEDSAYCTICKNADNRNIVNDIRVENFLIKTGYSNWKHARRVDRGFHQHESSNCHQQAIQRVTGIPNSTEYVLEMIKSNLIEI